MKAEIFEDNQIMELFGSNQKYLKTLLRKYSLIKNLKIATIPLLVTMIMIILYERQNSCINLVRKVNEELHQKGHNWTKCKKLQLTSAAECRMFDAETERLSSDAYLDSRLNTCSEYIQQSEVSFIGEKRIYPLAFSIITHKDPNQFAKYDCRMGKINDLQFLVQIVVCHLSPMEYLLHTD